MTGSWHLVSPYGTCLENINSFKDSKIYVCIAAGFQNDILFLKWNPLQTDNGLALFIKKKIIVHNILWNSCVIAVQVFLTWWWGERSNWVQHESNMNSECACTSSLMNWTTSGSFISIFLYSYMFHKRVRDDCVFSLATPLALIPSFSMVCGPKAAELQLLMRFTYQ